MGLMEQLRIEGPNDDAKRTELARFLNRNYISNPGEVARRKEALERKDLYKDGGVELMLQLVRRIFTDPEVRKLREEIVPFARFDNALKRVINELSTVYQKRPRRVVGGEKDNITYQTVVKTIRQDELFRRGNRWLNLFNEVLFWFRVRRLQDEGEGAMEPVMDVLSPDQFWAICHPDDATQWIGVILDAKSAGAKETDPHYTVWGEDIWFKLDGAKRFIHESLRPNPFGGSLPGVLAHSEPPDGKLLNPEKGRDLVNAHLMAWLENTMLIKESKSASKQAAFTGELSSTPTGQSQDTEADLALGEGVGVQMIDRGMDLEQFRATADHIIERAAANHGIPPSVLRHSGATSGFEMELRERRLRELRAEQVDLFRSVERDFAEVQSLVLSEAMPSIAFNPEGWKIQYKEVETPLTPTEELDLFERERKMALTNTIEFMQKKDPDLVTEQDAIDKMIHNISMEIIRNMAMRPLQEMNGSMGQTQDEAATPQENGAKGPLAAAAKDEEDEEEDKNEQPVIN